MELLSHHLSHESIVKSLANDLLGSLLDVDAAGDDSVGGQPFCGHHLDGVFLLLEEFSLSLSFLDLLRRLDGLTYKLAHQLRADIEPIGNLSVLHEWLISCFDDNRFRIIL